MFSIQTYLLSGSFLKIWYGGVIFGVFSAFVLFESKHNVSVGLRKDIRHTLFAVGSKGLCIKRVLSKQASSVPGGFEEGFTTTKAPEMEIILRLDP
jgi:hypothetical protein